MYYCPRTDRELAVSIQKATTPRETAPKRKHVRCITIYTHDHRSSLAFWAGIKVYVHPPSGRLRATAPPLLRRAHTHTLLLPPLYPPR